MVGLLSQEGPNVVGLLSQEGDKAGDVALWTMSQSVGFILCTEGSAGVGPVVNPSSRLSPHVRLFMSHSEPEPSSSSAQKAASPLSTISSFSGGLSDLRVLFSCSVGRLDFPSTSQAWPVWCSPSKALWFLPALVQMLIYTFAMWNFLSW